MAIEIKLPNLGDGIESGDVLKVLVREGDPIAREQGLLELETGKATIEVPSSHAGKVLKVHVAPGQSIPIGAVLVTVEETPSSSGLRPEKPGSPGLRPEKSAPGLRPEKSAPPPASPAPPAAQPAAAKPPAAPSPAARPAAKADLPAVNPPSSPAKVATPVPAAVIPPVSSPSVPAPPGEAPAGGLIPASPTVRRFAREVGVDLSQVRGTGEGGRVTRDDVLAVVRQANQVVRTSGTSAAPSASSEVARPAVAEGGGSDAWGPVRVERLPRIRQTIAQKMHESWSTIPRVTNFDDADVTELEKFRQSSKDDYAAQGIKLTSLPFVVKAVAMALRGHPVLNASIDVENHQVIYKEYVHVGVAVDSDRGLVVPSLRNADRMSIPEIARGIAALAEKVRANEFQLDELRGSTFTISNLGAIGGTYSTPIINVPEVAILLVGRSRKIPVVIDDQIVVRLMMPLSLSYDHRLVDGAAAARFLNEVIGYLKAPSRLLLAL